MADAKISALDNLTSADPANDMIPIVDVSATPPASGNTKRISINNLLACSPTATLASATITGAATVGTTLGVTGASTLASATLSGNLTVQTTNLVVTSTGVGMGTATPSASYFLDLTTANDARARLWVADTAFLGSGNLANGFVIRTLSSSTDGIRFLNYAQSTEFMRIDSTGLGIGRSPSYRFQASSGTKATTASIATVGGITTTDSDDFGIFFRLKTDATGANRFAAITAFDNGSGNGARDLVLQDLGGNVGIGISTFGTSAAKVLSIATGTEPTTGPAGSVQFFTSTRSASNTIPAIFTEGSGVTNAAITNTTVTNKIAIKVNGTIYYLLATTSAA